MKRMEELMNQLIECGMHPRQTIIREAERTGKRLIGCFPPHTPDELVYAAGYLPVGLWGGSRQIKLADGYLQSFACSIVRSNLELGLSGKYDMLDAVIIPMLCDHLKCVSDDWLASVKQPAIRLSYVQNRKTDPGRRYMAGEFEDTLRAIEELGGTKVSEDALENACRVYDDWRLAMQAFVKAAADHPNLVTATKRHYIIKAAYFMDRAFHTELIRHLTSELEQQPVSQFDGVRAVVTGVLLDAPEMLAAFDDVGIAVVADDLGQESRQFRNLNGTKGTVFERMAERVSLQDGDAFFHDVEKKRGRMLIQLVKDYHADGIIFDQLSFCDAEELDYPILKRDIEEAGIPILYIENNQYVESAEQIRTRLQSFREMLV